MKQLSFLLLGMLLCAYPGFCEEPVVRDRASLFSDLEQTPFRDELSRVARKAFALGQKRSSKIRSVNDSYQLTSEAIELLAEKGDIDGAIRLLREASKKFNGNRMSFLLLGAACERAGRREEAAQAYADFYRYSLTLVPMENKLIEPASLEIFRGYIEKRFEEWGRALPEPKVALNIRQARSLVMLEGSRAGQWINLILPLLVVAGLGAWILGRMIGIELPATLAYFLRSFYLWLVLAYLLWAVHFFLGLPFFISLEKEFALFFGAGILLISLIYATNRLASFFKMRRMIEGAKRCANCHEIILSLAAECPKCKHVCRE